MKETIWRMEVLVGGENGQRECGGCFIHYDKYENVINDLHYFMQLIHIYICTYICTKKKVCTQKKKSERKKISTLCS
jgi:hypothetical protein